MLNGGNKKIFRQKDFFSRIKTQRHILLRGSYEDSCVESSKVAKCSLENIF